MLTLGRTGVDEKIEQYSNFLQTSVTVQETHEVPAEDPVNEDLDPITSFAPTETNALDDKVAAGANNAGGHGESKAFAEALEGKALESNERPRQISYDFMSSENQDAKAIQS